MKIKTISIYSLLLITSLYSFPEADEGCSNTIFEVSPPDYAETEEEKVLRLEMELMLALEQFDSCLEKMENSISSSSSSSQSSSASGDEPQESKDSTVAISNVDQENSEVVSGDNGADPEDIPPDTTDDLTAAQMKAVARTEKDPVMKERYWQAYRKYKGINK